MRAGQALRGSSELHAWGDSNLYLRRGGDNSELSLTIEHRAARSADGIGVSLHAEGDALALRVLDATVPEPTPPRRTVSERVEQILEEATQPMTQRELRDIVKLRASSVGDALTALVTDGRVVRVEGRYQIVRR